MVLYQIFVFGADLLASLVEICSAVSEKKI
jgi:hypothetical protein